MLKRLPVLIAFLLLAPRPASADNELELLGGSSSRAPAGAEPAPVPELSTLAELEDDADTGVRVTLLVSLALERLSGLEVLISSTPAGTERDAALAELVGIRQSLHGALLEVGRLREQGDLRLWFVQQGLVQQGLGESAPSAERATPTAPSAVEPLVLTPDEYSAVTRDIEAVAFTTGKMQVLREQLDVRRVSAAQARGLMELFSFSRDRVDALIFLHPRIQDPENFDGLLSALKFESDRASVRSQLGLDG